MTGADHIFRSNPFWSVNSGKLAWLLAKIGAAVSTGPSSKAPCSRLKRAVADVAVTQAITPERVSTLDKSMDLHFRSLRRVTRRHLLRSGVAVGCASFLASPLATAQEQSGASSGSGKVLKITDLEFTEYTAHYNAAAGVNGQHQVNPLDVYEEL